MGCALREFSMRLGVRLFISLYPSTLESPKCPEFNHRVRPLVSSPVKSGAGVFGISAIGEKRNSDAGL